MQRNTASKYKFIAFGIKHLEWEWAVLLGRVDISIAKIHKAFGLGPSYVQHCVWAWNLHFSLQPALPVFIIFFLSLTENNLKFQRLIFLKIFKADFIIKYLFLFTVEWKANKPHSAFQVNDKDAVFQECTIQIRSTV